MSVWAEAHDLPHLADPGKKIAYVPMLDYRFGRHADAFREEGSLKVPTAWGRIDEFHHVDSGDHSNDVGSVIHFFQRGVLGADDKPVPVGSFVVERRPDDLTSQATSATEFSGRGLTAYFLDRMKLLPFDYPKNPTGQSDWPFGAPEGGGLIRDPGFEGSAFPNGGFEDGNTNHWQFEGGGLDAVLDNVQAHTGLYYGLWNPGGNGSRLRRSVAGLTIGTVYTFGGQIADLSGTGERMRVGVIGAHSAQHANAYFDEDEKIWWAEHGNATEGNGSTASSYTPTTLIFIAGEDSVELIFEYLDDNDHNLAVDSWGLGGMTVGLGAWRVASFPGALSIAEINDDVVHSGAQALKMRGSQPAYIDPFGRIGYNNLYAFQTVGIIRERIYTASAWVIHHGTGSEYFSLRLSRTTPQGPLGQTLAGGFLPVPGSAHMAANNVLVPPDTWTQISLTTIADTDEVEFQIGWMGALRPTTDLGTLTSPNWWVDDVAMYEGLPAVNLGEVWEMILTDRMQWLVPTYTNALDSAGVAWDSTRSFTLSEGDSFGQIAESFQRLWGYVHRIRYDREDNIYYFDIFNPGYVAFDHATTDSGSLTVGMNILGGETVTRTPEATTFRASGENGLWVEDEDTDLVAAWGEADFFVSAPRVGTTDDLTDILVTAMGRNLDQMVTFEAEMGSQPQVRPFEHIDIFHSVQVNLGGKSLIPTEDRIVTSIVCSGRPGQMPSYQVFVNSDAFASTGAAALAEAVRRLLRKRALIEPDNLAIGGGGGEGGGGDPTILLAPYNAHPFTKAMAHAQMFGDGNDHLVVEWAMGQIRTLGVAGRVVIGDGTVVGANGAIILGSSYVPVHLHGLGEGITELVLSGAGIGLTAGGADCSVSKLTLTNGGSGTTGIQGGIAFKVDETTIDGYEVGLSISSQGQAGRIVTRNNTVAGIEIGGAQPQITGHLSFADEIGVFIDGADDYTYEGHVWSADVPVRLNTALDGSVEAHIGGATADENGCVEVLGGSTNNHLDIHIAEALRHGVYVDDSSDNDIKVRAKAGGGITANTYDVVHVTGSSSDNRINAMGRTVSNQWRSCVNVGDIDADNNRVVDHDIDEWGTASIMTTSTTTLIGPAAHEWDLGVAADRGGGQAIVWDDINQVFVIGDASGVIIGGGGAEEISDLTDVSTAGASEGDLLTLESGIWVAVNPLLLPRGEAVGALVGLNSDVSITAHAEQIITWTDLLEDTSAGDIWDAGAPTRLTAPSNGWYLIWALIGWSTASTTFAHYKHVYFQSGGTNHEGGATLRPSSFSATTHQAILYLEAADFVEIEVQSGLSENVQGSGTFFTSRAAMILLQ
jgi:hypothetical protein